MNTKNKKQKPRTVILMMINAIAWCGYFVISCIESPPPPLAVLFLFPVLGLILAITTFGQLIFHFMLREKKIHALLRTMLFSIPSLMLIAIVFALPDAEIAPNEKQNQLSPNGNYILSVPTEKNPTHPEYDTRFWTVTIKNAQGDTEYKDNDSAFYWTFSAYWIWDKENRAWLYNSDDGVVYFWEKVNDRWIKQHWDKKSQEALQGLVPPESLYPGYHKKTQQGSAADENETIISQ